MGFFNSLLNSKTALNDVCDDNLLIEVDGPLKKELQATLLEMCKDVVGVCKKHGIPVALIGGSALGAVRHKGFIPWDDDLDLGMERDAYERFASVFDEELGDKYLLSAPNAKLTAKARFPKILKKDTVFEEVLDSSNKDLCKVFLDIFILENVPANKFHRAVKGWYCNALEFISGVVFFRENANEDAKAFYAKAGKTNVIIRQIIGKIFSYKNAAAWFDTVDRAVRYNKRTKYLCIATGRKHYFGEILERDRLFPVIDMEFEGCLLPVFRDQDYYLSNLYGDYMQIPPVEKRERHFVKNIQL